MSNSAAFRAAAASRGLRRAALLVALVVPLVGCGAQGGAPKTVEFGADIVVSESLNPDVNGRPSPLMLALYQLKAADNFRNKDFFTVFDPQGLGLGDDLLRREQMTLQPGQNRTLQAEFDAATAYIGVVGAFSDLENSQWRAVIEIPEQGLMERINVFKGQRLRITVGERSVAIALREG